MISSGKTIISEIERSAAVMNNIERVIEYINALSIAECEKIADQAEADCARIREEYSRLEQEDYWKSINAGTRETEQRLKKLSELAAMEAKKQLDSLRQEMLDKAFALAEKKLLELPEKGYRELLGRLGLDDGCNTVDVVDTFRTTLSTAAVSELFD